MTVKELIKALKKLNQKKEIGIVDNGTCINIYSICGNEETAYAICGSYYDDEIDVDCSDEIILKE